MSRYRGPRLRIVRRLGVLPGLTTKIAKNRKTPGQHGKEITNRRSTLGDDFKERLIEKQKLRYNYGVTEKQMVKYMNEAKKRKGSTELNLLELLEMRLDTIVFRLGLSKTIPGARQIVNHGHIMVNKKRVTIPSLECFINDTIEVYVKPSSKKLISENLKQTVNRSIPSHLKFDKNNLNGSIIGKPDRNSLDLKINELKVIEYYSR